MYTVVYGAYTTVYRVHNRRPGQAMAASERAAHLAAYRTNIDDKLRQIRTKRHLAHNCVSVTFIKRIYLMFLAGAPPNPSFHYVPVSDDEVRK